jgi:hypothetical protein
MRIIGPRAWERATLRKRCARIDGCDQDRTPATPLTDALLDIRNSCGVSSSSLARGYQRPREFPDLDPGS